MTRTSALSLIVAVLTIAGCSSRVLVEVPPRVDLQPYDVVGIIDFTSDTEGNLAAYTTQRFVQSLQESQPGVRVLELGDQRKLMATLGTRELDFNSMRKIGDKYGVDVLIVGQLVVSDVHPDLDLSTVINSMSASAKVDASLVTRLYETARGTTLWTRSTNCTRTVAHVGIGRNGSVRFDAKDPEKAYNSLVNALVLDVTRDFRVTYARQ